ncbi:hypothetical protein V8E54_012412 [Elaphomyces granulatus]
MCSVESKLQDQNRHTEICWTYVQLSRLKTFDGANLKPTSIYGGSGDSKDGDGYQNIRHITDSVRISSFHGEGYCYVSVLLLVAYGVSHYQEYIRALYASLAICLVDDQPRSPAASRHFVFRAEAIRGGDASPVVVANLLLGFLVVARAWRPHDLLLIPRHPDDRREITTNLRLNGNQRSYIKKTMEDARTHSESRHLPRDVDGRGKSKWRQTGQNAKIPLPLQNPHWQEGWQQPDRRPGTYCGHILRTASSQVGPDAYGPWRYDIDLKLEDDSPMYPTEKSKVRYTLSQLDQPLFSTMKAYVAENQVFSLRLRPGLGEIHQRVHREHVISSNPSQFDQMERLAD